MITDRHDKIEDVANRLAETTGMTIIFCNSKTKCAELYDALNDKGEKVTARARAHRFCPNNQFVREDIYLSFLSFWLYVRIWLYNVRCQ